MGKMIGIDLGTTNTVVAIMDGPRPRVLDSREGKPQIRSAVSLKKRRSKGAEETEVLVGDTAADNAAIAAKDTILSIKRLMGRGAGDVEVVKVRERVTYSVVEPTGGNKDSVRVLLGGKEYSPIDVSAMILKKAKEDAEFRLGEPVTHAVITVPAYFSQIQRDATRKAGLQAGLKVIKILEEPTAAAIACGTDGADSEAKTMLVYDLGGGTFDVSVLMFGGGVFAGLNLEGDMWLGGDDFDQVLIDYLVNYVVDEYGLDPRTNMRFMAELRRAASSAKERLSSMKSTDVVVAGVLQDDDGNLIDVDVEVTRDDFERMILPLVGAYRECSCGKINFAADQACYKCGRSLKPAALREGKSLLVVKKALANANQTPDQIDYVLMAGNSTNVPLVQRTMEEMFGSQKLLRKVHPKHSVAIGAAIVAARIGNRVVCQSSTAAGGECGTVNAPDATKCANCGATLELDQVRASDVAAAEAENVVLIGTIDLTHPAPFHYGTQSAGDQFNLFIRKGDPYPTSEPHAQTFYTRAANARTISIPVYGGDDLTRASANEKQGEAFVLLPPELPKDTPIRVRLWLDNDGVFALSAHLSDGTDLHPLIITKGEVEARAAEELQRVEELIAKKGELIAPQSMTEIEQRRERLFDMMRKRKFSDAVSEAQNVCNRIDELAKDTDGAMGPEMIIRYAQLILHEYSWAFESPNLVYRLNRIAEEAQEALDAGDKKKAEAKAAELETALNNLPESVRLFIGIRGAIMSRVQPLDPGQAAHFLEEMSEVERLLKAGDARGFDKLGRLAQNLTAWIEKHPMADAKCGNCGIPATGDRFCPGCGEDTWALGARGASTSR